MTAASASSAREAASSEESRSAADNAAAEVVADGAAGAAAAAAAAAAEDEPYQVAAPTPLPDRASVVVCPSNPSSAPPASISNAPPPGRAAAPGAALGSTRKPRPLTRCIVRADTASGIASRLDGDPAAAASEQLRGLLRVQHRRDGRRLRHALADAQRFQSPLLLFRLDGSALPFQLCQFSGGSSSCCSGHARLTGRRLPLRVPVEILPDLPSSNGRQNGVAQVVFPVLVCCHIGPAELVATATRRATTARRHWAGSGERGRAGY